jgi:hypothetical protein
MGRPRLTGHSPPRAASRNARGGATAGRRAAAGGGARPRRGGNLACRDRGFPRSIPAAAGNPERGKSLAAGATLPPESVPALVVRIAAPASASSIAARPLRRGAFMSLRPATGPGWRRPGQLVRLRGHSVAKQMEKMQPNDEAGAYPASATSWAKRVVSEVSAANLHPATGPVRETMSRIPAGQSRVPAYRLSQQPAPPSPYTSASRQRAPRYARVIS